MELEYKPDWDAPPPLEFDPDNIWWRRSAALLEAAAERAPGRCLVGLPDLNGPGEILARLRGTEQLCFDVLERPERIRKALDKINLAWFRYYEACAGMLLSTRCPTPEAGRKLLDDVARWS